MTMIISSATALRPGDEVQCSNEYGHQMAYGTVVEVDGSDVVGSLDYAGGKTYRFPAAMCRPLVDIEPLDPSITNPYVSEKWRSEAAIRLRTVFDEIAAQDKLDASRTVFAGRSRDAMIQLELMLAQEQADLAALAEMVPTTRCPAWCALPAGHPWESETPGQYHRTHTRASTVFGDSMQLSFYEQTGDGPSEPVQVSVQAPAVDVDGEAISVANLPTFVAELQRLAALAAGSES